MAEFRRAYEKTLDIEGGYANVRGDRGGETYAGISRRYHPDWIGWEIIDQWKRTGLPESVLAGNSELAAMKADLYRRRYWDALRLGELVRQQLADELFDSAVNCGVGAAARWLQQALNVVGDPARPLMVDGLVGPVTLRAANECSHPRALLKALNGLQFMHYWDLVESDPAQTRFIRGWLRRVSIPEKEV